MQLQQISRSNGRKFNELRPISISYDAYGYADASVLFQIGNTKVLCAITLQSGVPLFLKGKKTGWLKAEYAMLPAATHTRTQRESNNVERNGRSVEISRLIGRSLRAIVDLSVIGEQTIVVDCDVLQADGGTRTACITAASLALHRAAARWQELGRIGAHLMQDSLGAISIGIASGAVLLDIDCAEDTSIDADFNVVLTRSGRIVEIQGTAEREAVSWEEFARLQAMAQQGIEALFAVCDEQMSGAKIDGDGSRKQSTTPFFSLQNRIRS